MEDHELVKTAQEDDENLILCRVCGEWLDRRNQEEVFDHLEHTAGTTVD